MTLPVETPESTLVFILASTKKTFACVTLETAIPLVRISVSFYTAFPAPVHSARDSSLSPGQRHHHHHGRCHHQRAVIIVVFMVLYFFNLEQTVVESLNLSRAKSNLNRIDDSTRLVCVEFSFSVFGRIGFWVYWFLSISILNCF